MKITIWNVNGLRSAARQGFAAWYAANQPDVLGLQEVRAEAAQVPAGLLDLAGRGALLNPAERAGYSGVGLWTKENPRAYETRLGAAEMDGEGRLQIAEFEAFVFINAYFPNGKGKEGDNSRVPFKLEFTERVRARAEGYLRAGKGVIVGGDWNTAHQEIDLANAKGNRKTSGFLPEERQAIDRFLAAGFRDVFRDRHPGEAGHYTWWSQRAGSRTRNVGWRIDYFLVSENLVNKVDQVWIEKDVLGSDHCPVSLTLRL